MLEFGQVRFQISSYFGNKQTGRSLFAMSVGMGWGRGIARWGLNPISGRLLATPISGKGGCLGPPLDISGSYGSIFKIQTAFVSPQHDLHF